MDPANPNQAADPATLSLLRHYVLAQAEELEVRRAARQWRKPIKVQAVEAVACVSIGVAVACLLTLIVQGFTLYAGADVLPLTHLGAMARP